MSEQARRDENRVTSMLFEGSDGGTYNAKGDEITGRLYVDATGGASSEIIVENESSDTSCFPVFVTAPTGDLEPKSNAGLTFNSATSRLNATILASSSLTASELIATDGSKNLVSLATGTYPSLTELTYLKGVTSAIQTQLNAKANDNNVVHLTGNETIAGVKTFTSIPVLPNVDPTTANEATRKAYVDAIASSINPSLSRMPCRVATTANITIATALNNGDTLDGITLADGDRVLVKNQTAEEENGIYVVDAVPFRALDSDTAGEVAQGSSSYVSSGTQIGLYVQIEVVTTLDTDPINYALVGSPSAYVFDVGTDGTDFNVDISGLNITYNMPTVSSSARGVPTSAMYDAWQAKVDGAGTVVDNTIVTFDGTDGQTIQDSGVAITLASTTHTLSPVTESYNLTLKAVNGTGINDGGDLNLLAGNAVLDTGGTGGTINITGGTGAVAAGDVNIAGGQVNNQSGGFEQGGTINLTGGEANGSVGTGGPINITGGVGGTGGGVTIAGSAGGISGGVVSLSGGSSTSQGGSASLTGGAGTSGSGTGGDVYVTAGNGFTGGNIYIRAGSESGGTKGEIYLIKQDSSALATLSLDALTGSQVYTFPDDSGEFTLNDATQTLTDKRITKRVGTTTSSATPTINTDNVDMYRISAQADDITSFTTNLSGTPTDGQTLWIAITDNGTARAITWGASFEASTVALPTTTVISTRLDVGFVWNTVTSKWRCVARA